MSRAMGYQVLETWEREERVRVRWWGVRETMVRLKM